jgi:hypothetical protein
VQRVDALAVLRGGRARGLSLLRGAARGALVLAHQTAVLAQALAQGRLARAAGGSPATFRM